MDMEQVKALMKEVGSGLLATTDGDRAAVRPMGGWAWVEGELWCATGLDSAKVADIRKRPHIEYCFMNAQGHHVRIAGRCAVSSELSDKKQLLDLVPGQVPVALQQAPEGGALQDFRVPLPQVPPARHTSAEV